MEEEEKRGHLRCRQIILSLSPSMGLRGKCVVAWDLPLCTNLFWVGVGLLSFDLGVETEL